MSLLALANRAAVGVAVRPTDRCAASNVVQPFAICGSPSGSILSFFSLSLSPSYFRACVHIYIYTRDFYILLSIALVRRFDLLQLGG